MTTAAIIALVLAVIFLAVWVYELSGELDRLSKHRDRELASLAARVRALESKPGRVSTGGRASRSLLRWL